MFSFNIVTDLRKGSHMKASCLFKWLKSSVVLAGCLFVFLPGSFAQTSAGNTVPVVTVLATDPNASWTGDPGTFTVFRSGNPVPALNVYCCISGTASNGVDYQTIGSFVSLGSGVMSNTVVINPINRGQTNIETVMLDLCPSPLLNPVNYSIGSPSEAVVFISPAAGNLPPVVNIINPTNGAIYHAPVDISLLARAADPGSGVVTNVEFFAGAEDLGPGHLLVLDPPGVNGIVGPVYFLNWPNPAPAAYSLTAVATDNAGASTISAPVNITVAGPGSNLPPVVRITSPPAGAVYRAPVSIPIYAYAADLDGTVATVQFFAGGNSLGFGHQVIAVPPALPPGDVQPPILIVEPTNYWELTWTNPEPGTNVALTAEATDNLGASTTSKPVQISILPPLPPPTNCPALVGIVATDPVAIEGTNCWPWWALANPVPAWSNWFAASAVFRLETNCGPKAASFTVFRMGATNDDLDVNYTNGGTATNGIDYVALPGVVLVPAGQMQATIAIVPLDDGPPDINRTVLLKLAPGTNYLVGWPAAAAAIILDSSSPRAATGLVPGNLFHLSSTGPNGAWFHVEYSTDMIQWTALCTNQVVNGGVNFVDPDASTRPARFYRIVPEAGPALQ
jgi:hypothetical protein